MFKWLFILMLLPTSLISQQWVDISPFNDNYWIAGNFISENEGWIRKDNYSAPQEIFHTVDGGDNWDLIFTLEDPLEDFSYFQMFDSSTGWVKTRWQNNQFPYNSYTRYLRTSDGGFSWDDMTDFMPNEDYIESFYFFDDSIGLLGSSYNDIDYSANIYKTVDGGYNWYITDTPAVTEQSTIINYSAFRFYFIDENVGWAACWAIDGSCGVVLSTIDGGESWEYVLGPFIPTVYDIHFINPDLGGIACHAGAFNYLAITNDNFESVLYDYTSPDLGQIAHSICFQNETTIWITGSPGIINRSINGGESFEEYQTFSSTLNKIQFFNNTGYIFGSNNKLLKFLDSSEVIDDPLNNVQYNFDTFPNPFNPKLTLKYQIPLDSIVGFNIYNSKGQKVKSITPRFYQSGEFSLIWDGTDDNNNSVNSGVYFINLISDNDIQVTKKCVLLK
jgi:photosystem II stability/assembly factor-like uncharacterized protein